MADNGESCGRRVVGCALDVLPTVDDVVDINTTVDEPTRERVLEGVVEVIDFQLGIGSGGSLPDDDVVATVAISDLPFGPSPRRGDADSAIERDQVLGQCIPQSLGKRPGVQFVTERC